MVTIPKLIVASMVSVFLPSMALAQNCESFRQQAQNNRQQAAQEDAKQGQREMTQAAAKAYRNAAAQRDAQYQECVSGHGGGGDMGYTTPGHGSSSPNDALQNFNNQLNQYQSQENDRQRRQLGHEEMGRFREEQGENRAESERLRQLHDAEMQQEIERLDKNTRGQQEVNARMREQLLGKKLTPQEWASMFGKNRAGGGSQPSPRGVVTEEPCAASVLEFQGKGQATSKCTQTMKEALQARKENKTVEFPTPAQRLTPTDWSKRFETPSSPPTSAVRPPTPSPTVRQDLQPVVPEAPLVLDRSKRFGTSFIPATPTEASPEEEVSDPDANTKQSLRDRVSSNIKSIKDTVKATADWVNQVTSFTALCQRGRASSLYGKSYVDLTSLDQRGIDVECAAAPVGDNATVRGRYEYGTGTVESGGKLLEEAGNEIADPREP